MLSAVDLTRGTGAIGQPLLVDREGVTGVPFGAEQSEN